MPASPSSPATRGLLSDVAAKIDAPTQTVAADITDPAQCARVVDEVTAALGPIEILVSCAGTLHRDFVEDVKVEDFEASWRLHVGAALWLTQRLLPGMRERKAGSIVLVSSELGLIGGPSYASYCTSKWGLVGLAEVLHHELAGSGVRACAVCPGDIQTDQLRGEIEWGPTGGAKFEQAMSPEYVAGAIVRAATGRSAAGDRRPATPARSLQAVRRSAGPEPRDRPRRLQEAPALARRAGRILI